MTISLDSPDKMARATIPGRLVWEMLDGLSAAIQAEILAEAGLDGQELKPESARVSPPQFEQLYQDLVRRQDDEVYGFFPRPVPKGYFAVFAGIATRYGTARDVMSASSELYGLFAGGPPWSVEESPKGVRLSLVPRSSRQQEALLFAFTFLLTPVRVLAWLTQESLRPSVLTLDRRFERYRNEARYLFGSAPSFHNGPSSLALPAGTLDLPVRQHAENVGEWVRSRSLRALLSEPPPTSLESRVRLALSSDAAFGLGLSAVAKHLGMSGATLNRRLRATGTNFRQIRDDLRRDRAVNLLARGSSVADVAATWPYTTSRPFMCWSRGPRLTASKANVSKSSRMTTATSAFAPTAPSSLRGRSPRSHEPWLRPQYRRQ